ncbi:hypothetical protein [Amycolatopsis cihanbeyliensis]|uniref:Uncharacterized protein n=1 Tax=Amycolatopsis cihanbeyliensis TaxID=1128664 RepID=A0A542DQS3_AMYCI|nr:hypothetical protein [Amycolatopsis cihanbeyliensis]TQJ05396.1 hypothetical protein FB471_5225 [Amycolatopsis cihanbeyliensis]
MPDYIPPHMRSALDSFESALADFRTQRIRVEQLEVPDTPAVDPKQLAEAAQREDAPEKLKAVARAVEDGRATWTDVAMGRTEVAPEVRELFAASGPGIARGMAEAEADSAAEEAPAEETPRPGTRRAAEAEDHDDEDFSQRSFLRNGW